MVLPRISSATLHPVHSAKKPNPTELGASLPFSLNQTGTLLPRHPAQFVSAIDTAAKPISAHVYLRSVVWPVDSKDISFIAELAPIGKLPPTISATLAKADFPKLQADYSKKLMDGLGIAKPMAGNWCQWWRQNVGLTF